MKNRWMPCVLAAAAMSLAACSGSAAPAASSAASSTQTASSTASASAAAGDVMSYEEYMNADVDSEVTIEANVQGKQSWWEDKATIYAADPDGAYFIYNANVSQDLYDKLTDGTRIRVHGYKTEWSGEVEIAEGADIEIIEGDTYIAKPVNVTDLLGNEEELIRHQNQLVEFDGMTIEPAAEGSDAAYLYNYDGSGEEGDDLYFNASKDGVTYNFVVESYLTPADSEVYQAVKALNIGDVVNMEGFLYWYEGANPHIISVTPAE